MAAPTRATLPLPQELRFKVYGYLLSSEQPLLLYHDCHGRFTDLNLHTSILLISKATNAEATTVLYEKNTFKIDIRLRKDALTKYRSSWVQPLLPAAESSTTGLEERYRSAFGVASNGLAQPVISVNSFVRMKHIRVITSYRAVLSVDNNGKYVDDGSGDTLFNILKALDRPKKVRYAAFIPLNS